MAEGAERERRFVAADDVTAWLRSEGAGDEAAAESAFQRVCAAAPRVEPGPAFCERVVTAARSHERQRRQDSIITVAMVTMVVSGGAAGIWMTLVVAGPWLLVSGASLASGVLVAAVGAGVAGFDWWMTGARLGMVASGVLAYRDVAGMLLAVELLSAGALYALYQLAWRGRMNGASSGGPT